MDKIDKKRAEVQEQARRFIVRCDPPCEGCEVEVEEVVAAADAQALAVHDETVKVYGMADSRRECSLQFFGDKDCGCLVCEDFAALRARLAPRKGEEGEVSGDV